MVDAGVTGKALAPMAAMAKCFASDVAMRVATDAVQLFGAAGVSAEYRSTGTSGMPRWCRSSREPTRSSATIIAASVLGKVTA
jgi:alkylation response protein AidB-like acyl-CoA dehydrogenase